MLINDNNEQFISSIIRVLFSTDVAAMGVDTPDLHIGVSLGELQLPSPKIFSANSFSGSATTRWKNVQTTGRLARQPTEKGVFITVVEKKNALRGELMPNFINGSILNNSTFS